MLKKFILRILLYISILLIVHFVFAHFADGNTDPFYLRLTSVKKGSLILGGSRAAQGIIPKTFNDGLDSKFNSNIYNYSFTIIHSPYGNTYYKTIKKKLDRSVKNSIFIVTVDPWSVCSKTDSITNLSVYREEEFFLNDMHIVNSSPNYEYLIKHFPYGWGKLLYHGNDEEFLHDDGWLEISLPMDSIKVEERISSKIKYYQEKNLKEFKPSIERLNYLEKTIKFLKAYGTVYIVRLPIEKRMIELENILMPMFDNRMNNISMKYGIKYLNFISQNSQYRYTDGNHLYKTSSKDFSKILSDSINKDLKKNDN